MSERVSTDAVAAGERFDFWHEVICRAFVRLEAESLPGRGSFTAEIANATLGPLILSRVAAEPHAVHRSRALIADEPRNTVLVSVQLSGTTVVEQDDRQAVLRPGDFAMYDAARPYSLTMPREFEQLVLQFDRRFLLERCPSPEPLTAIRMSNTSPVTAPVSAFLRSLEHLTANDSRTVSHQLATSALDLLGVALADHFGGETSPTAGRMKHFLRACTYINAYADDPGLDPHRIGSAIGVSVRYLHQLFRDHDTSVSRYVMARRLARSMDDLVSAAHRSRTITEIALSHGFRTAAHFSRSFTETYGITPSEARRGVPPASTRAAAVRSAVG